MLRLYFRVVFMFTIMSGIICGPNRGPTGLPQDTALEDTIIPGVRSFRHSDSSITYPNDSGNSRGPVNDIDTTVVLPVIPPTEHEEEDFVELPDWMDIDLDNLPMDKVSQLNSAQNLTDLASMFGLTKEQQDRMEKESQLEEELNGPGLRFGGVRGNEITSDVEFAGCKPDLEVVELEAPPSTLYLPQCVRLQRCGGCCTGKLLSCQPTKTEIVTLKVMKLDKNYRSGKAASRRRPRRGTRARYTTVSQVNHVECSCQCRVQEHHCDKNIQDYKASECACVCKNRDEEAKCMKKSTHYWDRRSCSCRCRRTQECSTGEELSQDTCSCVLSSRNSFLNIGLDSRIPDSRDFMTTSELEFLPRAPVRRRNKPVRVPLQ